MHRRAHRHDGEDVTRNHEAYMPNMTMSVWLRINRVMPTFRVSAFSVKPHPVLTAFYAMRSAS